MIEVALYRPLIPQNTGNIGRLCVGFKTSLSLIGELGFSLDAKKLKRAGLDYWEHLDWRHYADFDEFYKEKTHSNKRILCLSKWATTDIYHFQFNPNDVLMAGSETTGVPVPLTDRYQILRTSIPIWGNIRSYNVANAIAMALSEATRQTKGNN